MILGYLDPGSGSLILQAVLGGLAGIGVAFKAWRYRFSRSNRTASPDVDAKADETEPTSTEP